MPDVEPGINLESEDTETGKKKKATHIPNDKSKECHANMSFLSAFAEDHGCNPVEASC